MGIKQLPSGRFRLQIRRSSLKVDETFDTEADARAAQERYLGGGTTGKPVKSRGMTLTEAWELYIESRNFLEKKDNTRRSEETHVKAALAVLGGRAVKSLTADDVDSFIVGQTKAGKAPDTIRNAVAAMSSILNFCRKRNVVSANVTIGVKRPSAPPVVKRMPAGHQGALMKVLGHPKYRYRAVARLALLVRETGARPGEWAAAQWDDLHLDTQKVVFKNTKYKRMPRTVPLTAAATALLTAQLEDITINLFDQFAGSEWIFPTMGRDGELAPIQYTGTMRDMKQDELLPKSLRAHNGRHEFISSLVESSDLDDSRIMSLVGHHSPASMQIYTHARNIRFLPQLEALEDGRRKERAQELAKALGVPPKLIDSYLAHLRDKEKEDRLDDAGTELLYEAESVQKLTAVAERLGASESNRMRTLLEIKARAQKRAAPTDALGPGNVEP